MKPAEKVSKFARALVTRTLDFEFERMPFQLTNVSNRKLLTLFLSEVNSLRKTPKKPWYPVQLQIEPTAACTLNCPLCPSGIGALDRSRRNMAFETFKTLIDEVADYSTVAIFWMWGEPFINPKLPDMIGYARSKNIATLSSTNGQHLQTREEAERLVSSGLDNLIVALDGATQETYSRYRVGGDVQKVFRCLELIRQAKDSLGVDKPGVNVRTVVMKHNEHELPEIEKIARKYGANMLSRKSAFMMDLSGDEADENFAPSNPENRLFKYQEGERMRRSINEFHCRRPWNRLSVNAAGTVQPCECDFNDINPFGKGMKGSSFIEAWRGPEASSFRKQFLVDRTVYPFCVDCVYRDGGSRECTLDLVHLDQ